MKKENSMSTKAVIKENIETLVIAFILAMFIRTFFFQAFRIPSGSMEHTLEIKDRLMVNKLHYGPKIPFTKLRIPGFTKPKRGDIVVFKFPADKKRDFIKRIVGLGGETVEIIYGDIHINGKLVEDPLIKNIFYYNRDGSKYGEEGQKIEVPEGHYFVLGDNSRSSHDSRYWGFVSYSDVIGKADVIYWPPKRIRFIK